LSRRIRYKSEKALLLVRVLHFKNLRKLHDMARSVDAAWLPSFTSSSPFTLSFSVSERTSWEHPQCAAGAFMILSSQKVSTKFFAPPKLITTKMPITLQALPRQSLPFPPVIKHIRLGTYSVDKWTNNKGASVCPKNIFPRQQKGLSGPERRMVRAHFTQAMARRLTFFENA